jgi:acyl carrier protein
MTRAAFRSMLAEILSVPSGSLQDSDTRETVKDWSSLVDVQIMTVIGSELALDEDPELMSFDSVGELLDELEQRGAFTS